MKLIEEGIQEEFPWSLGVFDAHCHPTDSMSSLDQIVNMKARVLTIMATRKEDQHLVAEAAEEWGLRVVQELDRMSSCQIVPSFGWHPWFSHQLYDDRDGNDHGNANGDGDGDGDDDEQGTWKTLAGEEKVRFFQKVLIPAPDDAFISSLPDPLPMSQYLVATRILLKRFPLALVGEIGIDRSFRIPQSQTPARIDESVPAQTPGSREGRRLSPHRVDLKHQAAIFQAQLLLAGDMKRAVSVHGVAAHGFLLERLRESWKDHEKKIVSQRSRRKANDQAQAYRDESSRPAQHTTLYSPTLYPLRVCLHSYSGPVDVVKQYLDPAIPTTIFFSFSELINFSRPDVSKVLEVIEAVPDDRILVESDLHIAGKRMDDLLEAVVRRICQIKGWKLDDGVLQLRRNWQHFALGIDPE